MLGRIVLALLVAAALTACSTPGSVRPGETEAAVRTTAGSPRAVIPLASGAKRWQYSTQPFGQYVWNVDFDSQGRVARVDQMMSDEAFARVKSGRDTRADILRDFGPPADTYSFPLKDETAFMYRYFIHGGFYAAMFIYFDRAGIVTRTETGMDPWRITDGGGDRK